MQSNKILSIIAIGHWNRRIFTPTWIKNVVLELPEDKEVQGILNMEDMDWGFKYEKITVLPKNASIEIKIEGEDEKDIIYGTKILNKILQNLSHTPIKALGFNVICNFNISETNPLLEAVKKSNVGFGNFKLHQTTHLLQANNYTIRILSSTESLGFKVNFNFQYIGKPPLFDDDIFVTHIKQIDKILENGNI
ncbi:MAG: hypothetical protein ABIP51_03095 [Bacteroidia bacterium]